MQVAGDAGTRHLAEVESDIKSLRVQQALEPFDEILAERQDVSPLRRGEVPEGSDVPIGGDEQMPVGVRIPVQQREDVPPARNHMMRAIRV